ncbi:MAG: ribonuclease R, partial [Bryobacteraceae bacterium]
MRKKHANVIQGRLSIHRDGYGFVIPDQPVPGVEGDIFVPRERAEKAMHGDRVLVRLTRRQADGRAEGEIVEVLERAHPTVVGEFRVRRRGNFVVPHDERIRGWIEIPPGMEVPRAAQDRIGPAAGPAPGPEEMDGLIVDVEILEYPEDGDRAEGRVIEVLGHPDDFGVDVEIVIRKHHLPHRFPADVLDQAERLPVTVPAPEISSRRDFRNLEIVTIDGETALDFDYA